MFLIHTITSIIAALLIIYLSLSCRFKFYSKKLHKWLGISIGLLGLISLVSSLLYGFTIELSFDLLQVHYYSGFISLILSEIPLLRYFIKSSKWHHKIGDYAAVFASIALITGFINYWNIIFPVPESSVCLTLNDIQNSSSCLVAVDGIVYDMTGMPRWTGGTHFDYSCGGNYSKSILPASHSASKYYGPVVGHLC